MVIDIKKGLVITFVVVSVLLIAVNVFLSYKYIALNRELKEFGQTAEARESKEKISKFAEMFIEKVLKAEQDVDFETRLSLETAVRELNDEEVFAQWQKFTNSKTKEGAQAEVKNLLEIIIKKLS